MLDSPRETDFDDLAGIAAELCGTPIAVVNLVDTDRQFFKAEVGLGVRETPLGTSFCGTAILSEDMMIIPDASLDARFAGNPLVTGEPRLRFYAGALLKSRDGPPIGTLCVLDYQPRELSEVQIRTLRILARQAMTQFELRRTMAEQQRALAAAQAAEREKSVLARLVEQSSDFMGMADADGRVLFLNHAARQLIGMAPDAELTDSAIVDYVVDADRRTVLSEAIPAATREGFWEGELRLRVLGTGEPIPVIFSIFPLRDRAGELVGYGTVTKDNRLQKEEQQRRAEVALEMAHRMKNTLAMVQAIVAQTFQAAPTVEEGRHRIAGRLTALANAQDILTMRSTSEAPITEVVEAALAPHRTGQGRFSITGPEVDLGAPQALGLSLALHELATNAAKYGALSNETGVVEIVWDVFEGNRLDLHWREQGGPSVDPPSRTGFGSKLLQRIVATYFEGQASLEFDAAGVGFHLAGEVKPDAR
jgi:PAS domain S-box-containing protein